jgi:broad specificity phosphatase PhoE
MKDYTADSQVIAQQAAAADSPIDWSEVDRLLAEGGESEGGRLKVNSGTTFFVVRHGATEMNGESGDSPDRIRGHIDVPLSKEGRNEAKEDASLLANQGIEVVYSSDLDRASDTAAVIAKSAGVDGVTELYDLRPWKMGPEIEGKETTKVLPKIKKFVENEDEIPKGGESFAQFKHRFFAAIDDIKKKTFGRTVCVVTHYRGVKALQARTDGDNIDVETFLHHDEDDRPGSIHTLDGDTLNPWDEPDELVSARPGEPST